MNARQRVVLAISTAVLGSGLAFGGATEAAAVPHTAEVNAVQPLPGKADRSATNAAAIARAQQTCPVGYACVYSKPNYEGKRAIIKSNHAFLAGKPWNKPKSAYNHGRYCQVWFYEGWHRHGRSYPLNRNTGWNYISSRDLPTIGSAKWC